MRILLDESVPVQVRNALSDHQVSTAVEMDWRGLSNGDLLDCAEAEGFQLLIVADKNFQHQQNLQGRRIAILELLIGLILYISTLVCSVMLRNCLNS